MAAPAPASSNPRWPRSGEPTTSPFRSSRGPSNGPGGRGRGAPPSRGARAAARPADTRPSDDQPKTPHPVPASPLASKPKPPPSRRASRPPPVNTTHPPPADVPSAPHSARPSSSRRRRSTQTPKVPAPVPSSIHAPAPADAVLRPGKPRLPSVQHTAPIKDVPPHLRAATTAAPSVASRTDIRHDIDALVERVRASAMDHHRPSTPGSHIDWAGDDDDSLPDLDDWGVTPAAFAAGKSDPISPIIVEGLRPLPDLAPQSYHASPLQRQVSPPPAVESHVGPPAEPIVPESQPSDKVPTPEASPVDTKPAPSPTNNKMATRKPLHPSLPAKPATVLAVGPSKPVAAATPMRIAPYPNSASHDTFAGRPLPKSAAAEMTPRAAEAHEELVGEAIAAEEQIAVVEATTTTTSIATAAEVLDTETPPKREATPGPPPKDPLDDFAAADGLRASIHAPRPAAVDAVRSAPAAVASFADVRPSVPPPPTHTRAHTVGRGPVGGGGRSPGVRAARGGGGGGAGRGGPGEGGHLRNHSSPAAAGGAYRSAHAARPVLTGAALSLLTRSIAGGGGSPNKSQTVTPLGD
ncbi:hypothetical protein BJ912DRAFT_1075156 [Pholiota molesta]|nr:hypothetical protein BJ912DRAFT_1075156 [Pholiota molesta]